MLEKVLSQYKISLQAIIKPFGTGLINRTWLVKDGDTEYIFQKINKNVFKEPANISYNIDLIENYLNKNHSGYFFVAPIRTRDRESMAHDGKDYYRLFPFVPGSRTYDVVQTPGQAFEAARQFGLFTQLLSGMPSEKLKITLPGFHDLTSRYSQFEYACIHGNAMRISEAKSEIDFIKSNASIVTVFENIRTSSHFKLRATHHDTKISNVLFDTDNRGICVIDLDTVMPGYFISDVGDMLRTYLSPVSEEETDFSRIEVREDYFRAILDGYLSCMAGELNGHEVQHFVYAGMFMIYMQAIRFLTDHLNNDIYYGAAYEGHNYVRAKNQITLLQRLQEKEVVLSQFVTNAVLHYS